MLKKRVGFVLILGAVYYIWLRITEIKIPCVFKEITGLMCPGCGITTMILNLTKFNWVAAFRANQFLFITLPFIIFEIIFFIYLERKTAKNPRWNDRLLLIYLVLLIIFSAVRNICLMT